MHHGHISLRAPVISSHLGGQLQRVGTACFGRMGARIDYYGMRYVLVRTAQQLRNNQPGGCSLRTCFLSVSYTALLLSYMTCAGI